MITKQGNALLKSGIGLGLKALKKVPTLLKGIGSASAKVAPKAVKNPTFLQEYKSQALHPLSLAMDGLSLAGGGSLGASVFGNAGGVLASRAIKPLTKRITKPWLRSTVNGAAMMGGDMAMSGIADKYAPIWRRKNPPIYMNNQDQTNQQKPYSPKSF